MGVLILGAIHRYMVSASLSCFLMGLKGLKPFPFQHGWQSPLQFVQVVVYWDLVGPLPNKTTLIGHAVMHPTITGCVDTAFFLHTWNRRVYMYIEALQL